jgi:Na+-transporting methylmalonyl-CoA/oxaloacetate decarboxylase gamma subunit
MDPFTLIVLGGIVLLVLFFLAVGFATRGRPVSEFLDKKANERWAAQAMIEESDTPQMVASANEYRRKRGKPELTVDDYRALANDDQRVVIQQALKLQAARQRPARRRNVV